MPDSNDIIPRPPAGISLDDDGKYYWSELKQGLEHIVNAGQRLIEVKERLKYGEWTPWLKSQGINIRTAQEHMQVAEVMKQKVEEHKASLKNGTATSRSAARRASGGNTPVTSNSPKTGRQALKQARQQIQIPKSRPKEEVEKQDKQAIKDEHKERTDKQEKRGTFRNLLRIFGDWKYDRERLEDIADEVDEEDRKRVVLMLEDELREIQSLIEMYRELQKFNPEDLLSES